jgi:hypothetical protein
MLRISIPVLVGYITKCQLQPQSVACRQPSAQISELHDDLRAGENVGKILQKLKSGGQGSFLRCSADLRKSKRAKRSMPCRQ